MRTNPNGANQYLLDPRQKTCWDFYVDPKSTSFGNARQSAIRASYTIGTANKISSEEWFVTKVRRLNFLQKAEKVLNETLEIDHNIPAMGMFGPIIDKVTKKVVMKVSPDILKIRQDTAKFLAERLGKNDGYSSRAELTGKDGKELPKPIYGGISIQGYPSDKEDIPAPQEN